MASMSTPRRGTLTPLELPFHEGVEARIPAGLRQPVGEEPRLAICRGPGNKQADRAVEHGADLDRRPEGRSLLVVLIDPTPLRLGVREAHHLIGGEQPLLSA